MGGVDSFGLQSFCLFEPPELNKTRIMSKKSTPAIGEKKGLRMFIVLVQRCGTIRLTGASNSANPTRQEFFDTQRVLVRYLIIPALLG